MSGDTCKTVKLIIDLQENGIMRLASNGRFIGRLSEDEEVNFEKLAEKATETGSISDGYHTFDELYFHRMMLFSILCKTYKENSWRSKLHSDGTMFENYFIVGITTSEGNYTYHYHMEYWGHFEGIKEIANAPEWDGHLPSDIGRLLSLL
ncbi:MAG: hypothetical protein ABFD25_20945 [Clostridiaceae bacterium]